MTLPGGTVAPQDHNANGAPDRTVSGVGDPPTRIDVPGEDTWGLRVRNPGGQVGTASLPTCVIAVQVDGQCGPQVTWEQCKADFDKGGIHIPNQPAARLQGSAAGRAQGSISTCSGSGVSR